MIRIGILGEIGSGKTYIANSFGYPVFNADHEVLKLYKTDKRVFNKLKKKLPRYIFSFPVEKKEITSAILANKNNLKKIINIVHLEVRKKLKVFLKKNKTKKIIILDIPLLLENKINIKRDILIFVWAKKQEIEKRVIKRTNFNRKLFNIFKKIQYSSIYKKKVSDYIILNNFKDKTVKNKIKKILKEIL